MAKYIIMFTLNELSERIQHGINTLEYPQEVPSLFDPVRYTLSAGGKRVRPLLVLMAANLFTDEIDPAIRPAIGLEMYHNFTLLHDDVMDNAAERRGRPTVHIKWDANSAILSGDAMQGLAYRLIADVPTDILKPVIDLFTDTNLEIGAGQQLDMEFETRSGVTTEEYLQMIKLKTSVLLGCALKMGAIIAHASDKDADLLYKFGLNVGLAFQLQDDWLDCYGDSKTFGKRIGGDILNNKKTYLLINALQLATPEQREIMTRELSPKTARLEETEKITYFTETFKSCGAEQLCREKIISYHTIAMQAIDQISVSPERLLPLKQLADQLLNRNI